MRTELLALLALGQTQVPDEQPEPKMPYIPWIGLNVGSYLPTSSHARDRFGTNWQSFSPGLGTVLPRPAPGLQHDLSFSVQKRQTGTFNNRAFLALVGAKYQWPLFHITPEMTKLPTCLPYAGVGMGASYANLRSEGDNVNGSSIGVNGSLYVGTSIGFHTFLEARYRTLSRLRGFDLSGADLTLGVRF